MARLRALGWFRRHPIWSVLLALAIGFAIYTIATPAKPTYAYVAAAAARGDVTRVVSASGKVRALNTIKVGSEVSGQVADVYVDFNSRVTAGQPLARIDPTRLRARVVQAEAQVQLARAGLVQSQAALTRARTDIGVQTRDYARRKELADSGFVSKGALDQAASALAAARGGIEGAQAGIASSLAQIRQQEAELQSARLDLSRTLIVAPTAGTVINKLVEPGATVAASFQTPNLFEIAADLGVMQVEASVDEADIGQVRVGQPVSFTVDAYPDQAFRASVRQIRTSATEAQNVVSYFVILQVANPDGRLLPGMTANVEIVTGARPNVMRVPTAALRFRPRLADRPKATTAQPAARRRTSVWVATADPYKPARRDVTVGLRGENHAEILAGLRPGDKVLVRSRSLEVKPEAEADDEEEAEAQ